MLRTFIARYRWHGRFQTWENRNAVVIAETESAAMGDVLMTYPDTQGANWEFELIDTTREAVYDVDSSSS